MNPQFFLPLHLFLRCSGKIIPTAVQFYICFQHIQMPTTGGHMGPPLQWEGKLLKKYSTRDII